MQFFLRRLVFASQIFHAEMKLKTLANLVFLRRPVVASHIFYGEYQLKTLTSVRRGAAGIVPITWICQATETHTRTRCWRAHRALRRA